VVTRTQSSKAGADVPHVSQWEIPRKDLDHPCQLAVLCIITSNRGLERWNQFIYSYANASCPSVVVQ
jgi:hypothetical protein